MKFKSRKGKTRIEEDMRRERIGSDDELLFPSLL